MDAKSKCGGNRKREILEARGKWRAAEPTEMSRESPGEKACSAGFSSFPCPEYVPTITTNTHRKTREFALGNMPRKKAGKRGV